MTYSWKLCLKDEDGSITVWFILVMFTFALLTIELFACFQLLYYRHAVDAAVEAAALSGASNAVERIDYNTNTVNVMLNREKADAESKWLFTENLKKNGLIPALDIRSYSTEVETDFDNRQWYKCSTVVKMKVEGPISFDIDYVSSSKGEINKNVILK